MNEIQLNSKNGKMWKCPACDYINPPEYAKCSRCKDLRPDLNRNFSIEKKFTWNMDDLFSEEKNNG